MCVCVSYFLKNMLCHLLPLPITEQEEKDLKVYKEHSRNFVPPNQEWTVRKPFMNRYCKRGAASAVLSNLPPSSHDPSSFTVDVLIHNVSGKVCISMLNMLNKIDR